MNSRTRQGGWIATFILVGTLLVVGLIGGVYYLKTQKDAADSQVATETSQPSEETAKPDTTDTDNETKKDDSTKEPSSTPAEPTEPAPSEEQAPAADSSALPETGPRETIASLAAMSAVAFSAVSYLRSRREANSLQ